jgi:glycosyltransferase involved in cell wall biosynthesis
VTVPDGPGCCIGIDATNLRQGGGRTHLIELLRAATPAVHGVERVVVWGGKETLAALDERPWLHKIHIRALDGGLIRRSLWQRYSLSASARAAGCDVLFVPGGSYAGAFHPVVTMSRNMLPFEWQELRRYGWSVTTLRLLLLRFTQSRSFRRADGVIFLTRYARLRVLATTGAIPASVEVISHGLAPRFFMEPTEQRPIEKYSDHDPYRLIYVSTVDLYKHPWHVVEAVAHIRRTTRWPLALDLVGPAYAPALKRLAQSLRHCDVERNWATYHGALPYSDLHSLYAGADLGIFASSCENMPNTLLEMMAAGLPVASSRHNPMPEILGDTGVYFDPEKPQDIASVLTHLIATQKLRSSTAAANHAAAKAYSWARCAADSFRFVAKVAKHFRNGHVLG